RKLLPQAPNASSGPTDPPPASAETPAEKLERSRQKMLDSVEDLKASMDPSHEKCFGDMGEQNAPLETRLGGCNDWIKRKPRGHSIVYAYRGALLFATGDYGRAAEDFSAIIDRPGSFSKAPRPWDVNEARQYRAMAFSRQGDHDHAIAELNTTIDFFSQNPDPEGRFYQVAVSYGGRGDAYRAKGDYTAALKDYREALALMAKPIPK